jgi:hypothetical protein
LKEIINKFFESRHKYLLECSNNILKLIKRQDLKYELITEAYLHITSNEEKFKELILEGKIESIVVNWMTMQIKWSNTRFKKLWVYKDSKITGTELENVEMYSIIDDDMTEEEYLEIQKDKQDKLTHIIITMSNEQLDKQLLFNDMFKNGINSAAKLAKHTGLSKTKCYYIMRDLKNSIKDSYKK